MPIYTGRGDGGETNLRTMERVSKASRRIEAYGSVDELNGLLGMIRPTGYGDVDEQLAAVQNHLHIVQADFANPEPEEDDPVVTAEHVSELELWIDAADGELEPLTSFILPGGGEAGAALHYARSVCRRAERRAVGLAGTAETASNADSVPHSEAAETTGSETASAAGPTGHAPGEVNEEAIAYLNRLSDYLFTAARLVNERDGSEEEAPTY